jgi:tetrapyrrole methylase family protein / MazG family protein
MINQFNRLFDIIKTLRSENGCPWDREQTVQSMASSLIEETHELVEAIETGNNEDMAEELGDLFFLALFVSYIAEQEGRLSVEAVIRGIADKLVRRHPHVFGKLDEKNVEKIITNWESIKLSEKKNQGRKTPFDGIPNGLPDVQRFYKILDKIKRTGEPIKKVSKEDLQQSFNEFIQKNGQEQLGNFLFDFMTYNYLLDNDLSLNIRKISRQTIEKYAQKH